MNIEYFNEYLKYEQNGIKAKKKETLNKFILSFENYTEKESWTMEFLPKLVQNSNGNGRIRNELFEEIIFPVLLNGYNSKNITSMIWLVKLNQNFHQNHKIWQQINYTTELEIIEECYSIDPNNTEVIDEYLKIVIRGIDFTIHEMPFGILYGNSFATKDECKELLEEIPLIKKLDRNNEYKDYIIEYENMLKESINKNIKKGID